MMRPVLALLLVDVLFPSRGMPQGRAAAVSAKPDGAVQITLSSNRTITVPKERGQAGISDAQISFDGTVGWFADYSVEGVSYPVAGKLIIWRAGKVIQRFQSQTFYSWTFVAGGKQVAYHSGPLHGEQKSHCELHEVASGRIIAAWDGDLDSQTSSRPVWTQDLSH